MINFKNEPSEIDQLTEEKKKLLSENIQLRSEQQNTFFALEKNVQTIDELKIKNHLQEKSIAELQKNNKFLTSNVAKLQYVLKTNERSIATLTEQLANEKKISFELNHQKNILNDRTKQIQIAANKKTNKKSNGETNNIFEADKIVSHRIEDGERLYRIRWVGFGPKNDTWEREKNLLCPSLLKEYFEKKTH